MNWKHIGLAAALTAASVPAQAAFITVDDSALDTITITAGDFERGLSINGVELTRGLFNSGSITLADSQEIILSGSWIDLGRSGSDFGAYFGEGGSIQSGVIGSASSDGLYGSIRALLVGYAPGNDLGTTPLLRAQDGSRFGFSQPFLSATFISEVASVPAPAPLSLIGLGLVALGLRRRTKA